MNLLKIIIYIIVAFFASIVSGQMATDSDLYQELSKKDSVLFNAAFNTCNTDLLEEIFTTDFEFYHDKGGLTESRDSFLNPMKENCSNRKPNEPQPSKRILIPNSLEVFPLYKNGELYGAIQHGVHRFEFLNENKVYQKGDIAKFTHVWVKENELWKVKRELSYDHQNKPN
ncbi:MAG: nuclear transport factor 2 family protein [Maribacter sp.]